MADTIETVKIVDKDMPNGYRIINKRDMTADDKQHKGRGRPKKEEKAEG